MSRDTENQRTKTHLSRLGVNPATSARLENYADAGDMSLKELVRYILSDYAPSDWYLYEEEETSPRTEPASPQPERDSRTS